MLLSGPAGGVTGAVWVAEQCGYRDLITFDMGGTSTDIALVQDLSPRIGRETEVGDLTVRASRVDVRTVGAGGGSIAHVPELTKALRVGPQSAGADPGPAAYGKGGTEPTVTDANVVLGQPAAGAGRWRDHVGCDAARAAVGTRSPKRWGCRARRRPRPGSWTSSTRTCSAALRLVSVQQGFDPRDFALVAFGGAGPLHANALGVLTGAWPVIVPPSPGCCARWATPPRPAQRVGPHRAATFGQGRSADLTGDRPARPPRRARRRSRRSGWPSRASRRPTSTDRRTRWTCATRGRASRSAIPVDQAWLAEPGTALEELARRVRRRARAAVLLPARGRPRAGQRPGHGLGATPAGRADHAARGRRGPGRGAGRHAPGAPVRRRGAGARLRPGSCAPATWSPARPSSPRWTPPPWCCPGTRPPCTPPAAC